MYLVAKFKLLKQILIFTRISYHHAYTYTYNYTYIYIYLIEYRTG